MVVNRVRLTSCRQWTRTVTTTKRIFRYATSTFPSPSLFLLLVLLPPFFHRKCSWTRHFGEKHKHNNNKKMLRPLALREKCASLRYTHTHTHSICSCICICSCSCLCICGCICICWIETKQSAKRSKRCVLNFITQKPPTVPHFRFSLTALRLSRCPYVCPSLSPSVRPSVCLSVCSYPCTCKTTPCAA